MPLKIKIKLLKMTDKLKYFFRLYLFLNKWFKHFNILFNCLMIIWLMPMDAVKMFDLFNSLVQDVLDNTKENPEDKSKENPEDKSKVDYRVLIEKAFYLLIIIIWVYSVYKLIPSNPNSGASAVNSNPEAVSNTYYDSDSSSSSEFVSLLDEPKVPQTSKPGPIVSKHW